MLILVILTLHNKRKSLMSESSIVYTSFDRFPAPKGASTHIAAFAGALGEEYGKVDLVTLSGQEGFDLPDLRGVRHHALPAIGENVVTRALGFRAEFARWWDGRRVSVIHVRSIFEGYPLARRKSELCDALVYEVNGFPSIELKYHYPEVAEDDELLRKLRHQEQVCLDAADLVITVSEVNAEHIRSRGVPPGKIRVIPNGVNLDLFSWREPQALGERPLRVAYTGTMSRWQGVHLAIEALQLFLRNFPAELILAGPCRPHERKALYRIIDQFGMAPHVKLLPPVSQTELVDLLHGCDAALAPLPPNDRNLEQGCCPLKVLEAMAAGTPLIASDLPVVRDLTEAGVEALLVRPGSAKAIKDGLLRLQNEPDLAARLSRSGRARVERDFTWERATKALLASYREFVPKLQCNR